MSEPVAPPVEQARSDARRAQILSAAADCFRRHGFHGASIAEISKAAGMSAGHIYHYFANKEAIIAAIVAQELARVLLLTAELRAAQDVRGAMVEGVAEAVAEHVDPDVAALRLEIVAEAARHPGIAAIVRAADARVRDDFAETIRSARSAAGHRDSGTTVDALVEVIFATFEGLLIRSVRNPGLDRGGLVSVVQLVLEFLLMHPADATAPTG